MCAFLSLLAIGVETTQVVGSAGSSPAGLHAQVRLCVCVCVCVCACACVRVLACGCCVGGGGRMWCNVSIPGPLLIIIIMAI